MMSEMIGSGQKNPDIILIKTRGEEPGLSEKEPGFFYKNIALDLTVIIPRNLWVTDDRANIELKGDVKIYKVYKQSPSIMGTIESIRGHYTFYNKEFEIQKGIVQFQGLSKVNPLIDMQTVYRIRDINIFIVI